MDSPSESDIIKLLVNIATHQLVIVNDIRDVLKEQIAINGRLEKLLQGLLPPSSNGH